jgi:co-chaperonin GroES (HSP10)
MIKALGSKILVEQLQKLEDRKSASENIFGKYVQSTYNCGKVAYIGEEVVAQIKEDDTIFFCGNYDKVQIDGKEFLVLEVKNLCAKIV